MNLADLDPHAVHSIMKIGGKKKLDTLIQMLKDHGPTRLAELAQADDAAEAHAAAQALKSSAINLGLSALEDLCDQILAAKDWAPNSALASQAQAAFQRGLAALTAERNRL